MKSPLNNRATLSLALHQHKEKVRDDALLTILLADLCWKIFLLLSRFLVNLLAVNVASNNEGCFPQW